MNSWYPRELCEAEDAFVEKRREVVAGRKPAEEKSRLGLALSGGGIRSATFCLGVLQTLARIRVLRRVDFLSTVSGGGYVGGFLGSLFVRKNGQAEVEAALSNNHSKELRWLRENGRHLAPNGSGDLLTALAIQLRSWLAVITVIGTSFLALFLGSIVLLRSQGVDDVVARPFWWWNPWLVPTFIMAAISLALAWAYWLVGNRHYRFQTRHLSKLAMIVWLLVCVVGLKIEYQDEDISLADFWTLERWKQSSFAMVIFKGGIILGAVTVGIAIVMWIFGKLFAGESAEPSPRPDGLQGAKAAAIGFFQRVGIRLEQQSKLDLSRWLQNSYSSLLKVSLVLTGCLLAFSILDRLGQALSELRNGEIALQTALTASGLTALFSFGDKLGNIFERLTSFLGKGGEKSGSRLLISFRFVALLTGLGLLGVFLLSLDAIAHAIAGKTGIPAELRISFLGCTLIAMILGRNLPFLNASSMQYLYGSRLVRAYLGATNPDRHAPVTEVVKGDDCWLDEYRPHEKGGPLHLINITFNETCSGESQLEQRDRKGLQFAVGPAGISVGARHHALWLRGENLQDLAPVKPLAAGNPECDFQIFPQLPLSKKEATRPAREVQRLTLGHWVAISGAAFGTGLGQRSSLGMSLLAGLANIRLGYWWDSKVRPGERCGPAIKPFWLVRLGNVVFKVQAYLLSEWLCRFHGPARRHWYLSDGGHFENSAVYELLRRRVSHVLCCDCGADPDYDFADVANLARKARIDFNAEVTFVSSKAVLMILRKLGVNNAERIATTIGLPEEFNEHKDSGRQPHAMLAVVQFPDAWPGAFSVADGLEHTLVLFLKPALSGDEPLDLWEYDAQRQSFPQESTADQFFDEAQWESYRKLGEHTARHVLGAVTVPVEATQPSVPWFLRLMPAEVWTQTDDDPPVDS